MNRKTENKYAVESVLSSFADPRTGLFIQSLNAEIAKYESLVLSTPAIADLDPPDLTFGGRRKGYYKCPRLCRVLLLEIFKWCRIRGEWFVKWVDPSTKRTYDGRMALAHAVTIKYLSMHKPAINFTFSRKGHLKSTSDIFKKIRT